MTLELSVGQAQRPLDGIPIYLQVGSQAQLTRRAGQKDIFQVDQAGLFPARRESQVGLGGTPSAVPIGNFKAKSVRLLVMPLADGDVY